MKRREFVAGVFTLLWPRTVQGQSPRKIARIGFLSTRSMESFDLRLMFDAFRQGLREHGYIEGENIVIELQNADGQIEQFPARARELVDRNLDLIVASHSLAARAVQRATSTIPIVVPVMGDPVGDGLVASIARPGGNITGSTFLGPQLVPKRLALLKEGLPAVSLVAVLWHPGAYGERTMSEMMKETEAAARALDVRLLFVAMRAPDEMDRAFSTIAGEHVDALMVYPSPMLFNERRRIVDLALKNWLPSMAMGREFVELGGLMAYGASIPDLHRRAAMFVDRILKGDKPENLPVQLPTNFEFAINLKTAKALNLSIPSTLLARADEVIE